MTKNRRRRHPGETRDRRSLRFFAGRIPAEVRRMVAAAGCGLGLSAAFWWGGPVGWQAIKAHTYFAVTNPELSGNARLTRDEVLTWAGVPDGTSVWDAKPNALKPLLEQHPWIERASVFREFPRRVVIRIRERTPVAIVSLDGHLNYVDRAGRVLGPLRDEDSRDLPIITGLDGAETKGFSNVALHRSLQLLRSCERLRCFDAISEVRVDRVRGLTVFPLRTPVPVRLGWGNWRDKLARSARVFETWEGQTERLAQVDVSYRNMTIVKLHEAPKPPSKKQARRGMKV